MTGKRIITGAAVVLLLTAAACRAGCGEKSPAACKQESKDANSVEKILNLLKKKTAELDSYQCQIEYLITQPLFESKTLRRGILYYTKHNGPSMFRINFQTLKQDQEQEQKYNEQYIFDGVWLTYINYQSKQVKRYQQAEPNKPVDDFDLASENLPIIGFGKIEELQKQFDISPVEQKKVDAEKSTELHLKVKPDSIYKDNYTSINLWIDNKLTLPTKIAAVSTEEDIYQIEFLKPEVNERIDKKVFELKIPKDFSEEIIPLKEKR